jgi:hypothetical protein
MKHVRALQVELSGAPRNMGRLIAGRQWLELGGNVRQIQIRNRRGRHRTYAVHTHRISESLAMSIGATVNSAHK